MRVSFLGEENNGISVSSHHAQALTDTGVETRFDSDSQTNWKGDAQDRVIHLVSRGHREPLAKTVTAAMSAGIPVVRYWTNRSALWAKFDATSLEFARSLSRRGAVNVTRSEMTADTLNPLGIDATALPALSLNLSSVMEPTPLPATFSALCYLPGSLREFYGGAIVDRLILRFPTVRFLILGDVETDYSMYRNVESVGTVEDISRLIKRSTVLVEPRLDAGLSRLALEALSHGRHVISTHTDELFCHADSVDGFADALRLIRQDARYNLAGREAVCRLHDRSVATEALIDVFRKAHDRRGQSLSTRRAGYNHRTANHETDAGLENRDSSAEQTAFQILRQAESTTTTNHSKMPAAQFN
ncbi:MAG: glycosyltransferase [Planctomycetes bacterium]|nr:glycosyltransferase [Planctomycetota bacterium]